MSDPGNDAPSAGTVKMTAQFESMNELCLAMTEQLDDPQRTPQKDSDAQLLKDGLFCLRLGMVYYAEANLAVQAKAWFAATAIGSAALEAILLAKCLMQAEEVRRLQKFRQLKKGDTRDFLHFAKKLDLGKLLELADELSWFPAEDFPGHTRTYWLSTYPQMR